MPRIMCSFPSRIGFQPDTTDGQAGSLTYNDCKLSAKALHFSQIQVIQRIHQVVQLILRPLWLVCLPLGDADRHADRFAAIADELAVAFLHRLGKSVLSVAAEEAAQVDFEAADRAHRSA